MSNRQGPNFVCIGTQKSGTTWLYENLANRQDVWMPPIKELHYFNRVCINDQLLGKWDFPAKYGLNRYSEAIKRLEFKSLRWVRRYYELGMTGDWYLGLFDKNYTAGKLSGDITPGYSTLEERGVKYASEILGKEIPIIFIVRNPVHRSWSAMKMIMRYRSQSVDDISAEELIDLLESPTISLCNEYTRIIPLWKKYFNNFHVLSYDELCESPRSFLYKISLILNLSDNWNEQIIGKRVWSDKRNIQMPPLVIKALIEHYAGEINALRSFDECGCAEAWYKEMLLLEKDAV